MHGSPCEMGGEQPEMVDEASPVEVIRDLLASPPSNPEEFMAKLKESGYELRPVGQQDEEEAHSFLPPQPKMVILRLDAAKNALKEQHHE